MRISKLVIRWQEGSHRTNDATDHMCENSIQPIPLQFVFIRLLEYIFRGRANGTVVSSTRVIAIRILGEALDVANTYRRNLRDAVRILT